MNRLIFIPILVVTFFGSVVAAADKPNILWLIAEDIGPEVMSNSGTPQAHTPTLDRLAKQGVRYTRAYATAPVCSPSRSSLMTGMYAAAIGAHEHRTKDKKPLPDGVRTLPEHLRDAGYFTANIKRFPEGIGARGTGKTDLNFEPATKLFDSERWTDLKQHQPFYAQVNFHQTHRAFRGPRAADPARVQIPPYYPDHPVTRADWAAYLDAGRQLDDEVAEVLELLEKDGLADNTIVVFIGDNGQAMVRGKQFCYEEGLHLPLIIRWPKGFPAPRRFTAGGDDVRLLESIDVTATMLVFAGAPIPSTMQGRPFLGDSSAPPREYVFGARDRCDETEMKIRTVRDARYRYIRNLTPQVPFLAPNAYKARQYPVWNLLKELHDAGKLTPEQEFLCQPRMPDEELYDLESDPHEVRNLAASTDPAHQQALRRLRAELDRRLQS